MLPCKAIILDPGRAARVGGGGPAARPVKGDVRAQLELIPSDWR
jgi:hypothetical protein